jgi:simple sugar transport system permease protein
MTVTLRANQNVTGLTLTIFGSGVANFFGGSLVKLSGGVGQISVAAASSAYRAQIPFLSQKLGIISTIFFNYGFLTYTAILIALAAGFYLKKTRSGLNLRAVGENPATADAAGINVNRYKYVATCVGSMIAGLGGLYYVFDYANGVWSNNAFGDRGWLAIALVIFCVWRPNISIFGSILFGGLFIVHNYIPNIDVSTQELIKMTPYLVTIIVLVATSMRKKRETQPPASLGLSYFREDR